MQRQPAVPGPTAAGLGSCRLVSIPSGPGLPPRPASGVRRWGVPSPRALSSPARSSFPHLSNTRRGPRPPPRFQAAPAPGDLGSKLWDRPCHPGPGAAQPSGNPEAPALQGCGGRGAGDLVPHVAGSRKTHMETPRWREHGVGLRALSATPAVVPRLQRPRALTLRRLLPPPAARLLPAHLGSAPPPPPPPPPPPAGARPEMTQRRAGAGAAGSRDGRRAARWGRAGGVAGGGLGSLRSEAAEAAAADSGTLLQRCHPGPPAPRGRHGPLTTGSGRSRGTGMGWSPLIRPPPRAWASRLLKK